MATECSECGEEFTPLRHYYHRCPDCQAEWVHAEYGVPLERRALSLAERDYDAEDYEFDAAFLG